MKPAYLDTSFLLAILFDEPRSGLLGRRLGRFDTVVSSPLLEAEVRSAFMREGVSEIPPNVPFSGIHWVVPDRRLTPEIGATLRRGYLRGADLWHVACALFVFPEPKEAAFLTLDGVQRKVADSLGFGT